MKKEPPLKLLSVRLAREKIDMIVAGALEKEVVLHPLSAMSRAASVREAPCSVMLFTMPAAKPKPLRRIVFVADYSGYQIGGFEENAAVRFGGIVRAALCDSYHHHF